MAPKRKTAEKRKPYESANPEHWTIAQLREKLLSFGLTPAKNVKRMELLRMLKDASTQSQQSNTQVNSTNATPTRSVGGGDREILDVVSRLSTTVQQLQQSMISLTAKVNTIDSRPHIVLDDDRQSTQRSSKNAEEEQYDLNTATKAFNERRHIPAAAGSESQLQRNSENIVTRTRYGYAAETLPLVETVTPAIRQNIIAGKDVNLASLLMPYYNGACSSSDDSMCNNAHCQHINKQDPRLNKTLSIGEFIQAFGIYKNIMCSAYPLRRTELDLYERDIVEMASRYPGRGFYEYHKQFSLRAAAHLRYNNILIDWSVRNNSLFCNIFANTTANSCITCGSTLHSSGFCPDQLKTSPVVKGFSNFNPDSGNIDRHGRKKVYFSGREICNNFNGQNGCTYKRCTHAHVCLECKGEHSKVVCSKNDAQPLTKGAGYQKQ